MRIQIIKEKITFQELTQLAKANYGEMIKGVVDIGLNYIALGGELHADAEALLLEEGSQQTQLWGFNLYPKKESDERIEYTSFINIRPSDGNKSIEIQDESLRLKVRELVDSLVSPNE